MPNSSSSTSNQESRVAIADRMGLSAVNAVVIALLLWVGSTLNGSQIAVASLKVEITQLRVEMNRALDADSNQRERMHKAEKDIAQIKARMGMDER